MKFLTEIQFATGSLVESPPSDFIAMYVDTDGNLYAKTSDGKQIKLSNTVA